MVEEEREDKRGFRVQDRRRFSPETGEPRATENIDESAETTTASAQERPHASEEKAENTSPPRGELSFSSFILGISTQTLMYMGEIPPAPGQPIQRDFAAAQQMIEVLAMLKQKTAGNLDAGESTMLENALFDLRVRYVDLVKKGRSSEEKA
ncbi:MAG: DUF1844 domain-containing protein [Candidatus Binatia bacterium]